MSDLDLHADAEQWPDNRDEETCEHCGGSRVAFIPVWSDGSGILTVEEIIETLEKAKIDIEQLAVRSISGRFAPARTGQADDLVLYIEGHRDGTFLAEVSSEYGSYGQAYVKYGTGSTRSGLRAWQAGLANCTGTEDVSTPEDLKNKRRVYTGRRGYLSFRRPQAWEPSEQQREEMRARQAIGDRSRPTTSWERHKAALLRRETEERLPPRGEPPS